MSDELEAEPLPLPLPDASCLDAHSNCANAFAYVAHVSGDGTFAQRATCRTGQGKAAATGQHAGSTVNEGRCMLTKAVWLI